MIEPTGQLEPKPAADSALRQILRRIAAFTRGISAPADYTLTGWLFVRALGLIYLVAFLSLWTQILGLIGSHGILPASSMLTAMQNNAGNRAYWDLPTIFWLNSSDAFLTLICGVGVGLALLVIFDVLSVPALAVLWFLYLSLVYAGQDFLQFQWDLFLVEVGFLAIFLVPFHLLPRLSKVGRSSRAVIWLYRLLLFRLLLESGVVKLASGDPTWRNLTATTYHYWTQPLPTPLAWYMNLLPLGFHQAEVLFTFLVELIVPFFIFGPRRLRIIAAVLITAHQLFILLTGNYTFFNMLTIALCVLLLDDAFLVRILPRRLTTLIRASPAPYWTSRRILIGVLIALIVYLNGVQLGDQLFPGRVPIEISSPAYQLESLRLVNGYGLFAVMTTSRPEIIIEGSMDGQTWQPYEFRYKAGDLARPPAWVEPFQPRLDWQMWFAALEGSPYNDSWFMSFIKRLLEGSPDVLALLDKNPFPGAPPRYIRATLYTYHFTDVAERQATGDWWQRELAGTFMRSLSLDDFGGSTSGGPFVRFTSKIRQPGRTALTLYR